MGLMHSRCSFKPEGRSCQTSVSISVLRKGLAALLAIVFLLSHFSTISMAQTLTIRKNNLIACRDLNILKTLQNMINVGETHISSIYLKKMTLNGICIKIRPGEKIAILRSTPDTEFVILKRLANGQKYYMSSQALGLKS